MILEVYFDYNFEVPVDIKCKNTAIILFRRTGDERFANNLWLSDVIKVLEYIQYNDYDSKHIEKLNLKNKDRKFMSNLIHQCFREGRDNVKDAFTRRKAWKGLLHHLHFRPITADETRFLANIRDPEFANISAESTFERLIEKDPAAAARSLAHAKGGSAVARNLNYILSRCDENEKAIEEVLSCL